jgi:hypothetical protein
LPVSVIIFINQKVKPIKGGKTMKAGILFTGTGPILILTSYNSLTSEDLLKKLAVKGIRKFIGFEVPEEMVKKRYGNHFNVVMGDLKQKDDLRVLDYDGHHVFYTFSLNELSEPIFHDIEQDMVSMRYAKKDRVAERPPAQTH